MRAGLLFSPHRAQFLSAYGLGLLGVACSGGASVGALSLGRRLVRRCGLLILREYSSLVHSFGCFSSDRGSLAAVGGCRTLPFGPMQLDECVYRGASSGGAALRLRLVVLMLGAGVGGPCACVL